MQHSDGNMSKMSSSNLSGTREGGHSEAARRALVEAEERRRIAGKGEAPARKEINGRGGLDPARFGDWEVKGIASDF